VALQHCVRNRGEKGQQGPADNGDGPVSLPSLVPMSGGARNSTSGGYPGAGNGRWSTNN